MLGLSCVNSPLWPLTDVILSKLDPEPGPRYLVAFQMFFVSSRNSIQCRFFCLLIAANASSDRVTIESGSIKNAQWVQRVLTKYFVSIVFLCLTDTDELSITLNFLDAIQRAGHIKQLIYLSACGDFVSAKGVEDLMRVHGAAHVLVKSIVEQKLIYGAFPWKTTRLGPLLFVSNDLRSKNYMLTDGLFDEPLGEQGVGRVFESDIALAACNAILEPGRWVGKKINIGSLRRYKGSEVAKMWSRVIRRTVSMCENDDDSLLTLEDRVQCGQQSIQYNSRGPHCIELPRPAMPRN